jgi:6-phosphogluconolactonase
MTATIRHDHVGEIRVFQDIASLVQTAAERFVELAAQAIDDHQRFLVALSGGNTPRPLYELLATDAFADRIDWTRVEVFFTDERCVPPDHPDSNYLMARLAFLDKVPIPPENVHRIHGGLPPTDAALAYHNELGSALSRDGRLDLILLGMGPDGHTASLFPGSDALEEKDTDVVAIYVEHMHSWRVTLTLPALNAATNILFLVSGARKAPVLARVFSGEMLPAGLVRPDVGTLTWFVDQEAASLARVQARAQRA